MPAGGRTARDGGVDRHQTARGHSLRLSCGERVCRVMKVPARRLSTKEYHGEPRLPRGRDGESVGHRGQWIHRAPSPPRAGRSRRRSPLHHETDVGARPMRPRRAVVGGRPVRPRRREDDARGNPAGRRVPPRGRGDRLPRAGARVARPSDGICSATVTLLDAVTDGRGHRGRRRLVDGGARRRGRRRAGQPLRRVEGRSDCVYTRVRGALRNARRSSRASSSSTAPTRATRRI